MWVTADVHIPKELIEAQRQGRLAVFVGAGVSMGPPSDLPSFERLANEIAGGVETPAEDESFDRFLGRLASQGIKVHERAREILTPITSRPTSLHFKLISLFSAYPPRIVTTNFDHHFTTVLTETDLTSTEIYYSPALPLGGDFDGLVYLHGSVDKKPKDMILTDSDFGKAYLTDGWIARFLPDMFARYTVLFVGYSHTDPVMHYLARGLPPGTSRYAFTEEASATRWKSLGIESVPFPLREGPDKYGALRDAIISWSESATMSALQREARIRQIVELPPQTDPVSDDVIKDAVVSPSDVAFVTRYARTPDWLDQIERYGALDDLLQPKGDVNETKRRLAWWIAEHYVCEYCDATLDLVQKRGSVLHPELWNTIAHQLVYHKPPADARTRLRWTAELLRYVPSQADVTLLDYLLRGCNSAEDKDLVLFLMEYLTRPTLERGTGRSEIVMKGDPYWLYEAWWGIISANMEALGSPLMGILANNMTLAHVLCGALDEPRTMWDALNFRMDLISAREEIGYNQRYDFVIDIAGRVLAWLAQHRPLHASGIIASWSDSDFPLLQRLSVKGMGCLDETHADSKSTWLLEKDWLFNWRMKPEVFELLRRAYPQANEPVRERLLSKVLRGSGSKPTIHSKEGSGAYEIYNLLVWLRDVAPECTLAKYHLEAMQSAHLDFKPREHPELILGPVVVEWRQDKSPLDVKALLSKEPTELIDFLLTFQGDLIDGPDRHDLLSVVGEAAAKSFDWSLQLAEALEKAGQWGSDVSGAVISGWRRISLADQQLAAVLQFLIQAGEFSPYSESIPDVILGATAKSPEPLSPSTLVLAELLMDQIWQYADQRGIGSNIVGDVDWFTIAISHVGGISVQIWIQLLSKQRAIAPADATVFLPEDYRERFEHILLGTSSASVTGRVILASQIRYLFSIDAKWTIEHILPLFDWSADELRAKQAWDGYLTWGRFDNTLLAELLPMYEQSFGYLESWLGNMTDRFCAHLADIALYTSFDPSQTSWLDRFLRAASGEIRGKWAAAVGQRLSSMSEEQKEAVWSKWLDSYWSRRLTGVPLPLGDQEKEAMVLWSLSLGKVFPSAVPHILQTPAPGMLHRMIYRRLRETGVVDSYPNAVADLCDHLLSSAARPFWECADVGLIVEIAAKAHVSTCRLLSICNKLAALGCENASSVAKSLEDVDGQT